MYISCNFSGGVPVPAITAKVIGSKAVIMAGLGQGDLAITFGLGIAEARAMAAELAAAVDQAEMLETVLGLGDAA